MLYDLTWSVIFEFSAYQERLAVWIVLVIGIATGIDFFFFFFDYFCAFWDLLVTFEILT